MITPSKTCPRCAERVRAAAQVCRYCGHEFSADAGPNEGGDASTENATGTARSRQTALAIAISTIGVISVGLTGWAMAPAIDQPAEQRPVARRKPAHAVVAAGEAPAGPELAVGQSLDWTSDGMPGETVRQVGPLVLRVNRRIEDDMVAPVLTVSNGADTVTMVGELVSVGFKHRISAVRNTAGAPAVIMLQSFTGGAHCCNHVQLAGMSSGRLKVIDLGSTDGDEAPIPLDLSGDGVADIVGHDDAFLYAFAPYAMSYAPPTIVNVRGGRVVDVSKQAAFRRLYIEEMRTSGETCRNGGSGADRNGACPSYVASAARVGQLERAWADMVASYAADAKWVLPTGCAVRTTGACPEGSAIVYKSYPEALLAFLKARGYVSAGWSPPTYPASGSPGEEVGLGPT